MSNRQSKRRTTAVLTAVLLLFCQVAFAAQACANHLTAAVEAAVAPCHHAAAESDGSTPPAGAARSGCEAPALASEGVNLPVMLAAALPAAPHSILVPFAAQTWQAPTLTGLTHCHSPPLTILHCRLLN